MIYFCELQVCRCASMMSAKSQILANLVKRTVCLPATSAPVEQVFSHGGIVVHPQRLSLASQRLHKILFLKCNEHAFDASKLL